MDTFHSAKIIGLTSGTGIVGADLPKHKTCTITSGRTAMGITLDFVDSNGAAVNTGHIRIAGSDHIHIPSRIYGATCDQAQCTIIIYN